MHAIPEHDLTRCQHGEPPTQPVEVLSQRQKLAELIGTLLARQWWRARSMENAHVVEVDSFGGKHTGE